MRCNLPEFPEARLYALEIQPDPGLKPERATLNKRVNKGLLLRLPSKGRLRMTTLLHYFLLPIPQQAFSYNLSSSAADTYPLRRGSELQEEQHF